MPHRLDLRRRSRARPGDKHADADRHEHAYGHEHADAALELAPIAHDYPRQFPYAYHFAARDVHTDIDTDRDSDPDTDGERESDRFTHADADAPVREQPDHNPRVRCTGRSAKSSEDVLADADTLKGDRMVHHATHRIRRLNDPLPAGQEAALRAAIVGTCMAARGDALVKSSIPAWEGYDLDPDFYATNPDLLDWCSASTGDIPRMLLDLKELC
jgi:hypothetical protein